MPRGDGTGPSGKGPGTGRGLGKGQGKIVSGVDFQIQGRGPGGYCLCPNCGAKAAHHPAKPCTSVKCPDCGTFMNRE
ncbi:MAG: DUF5320 domain-containing protein [Candidatus Omnitrophica bacterium]|nr:DUF5320 domain-containing protein [Candidatus Omnitrophota bacterium]